MREGSPWDNSSGLSPRLAGNGNIPLGCLMSDLCVLNLLFLQGDFEASDPSGQSWSPAGPNPHVTVQRNGENSSVILPSQAILDFIAYCVFISPLKVFKGGFIFTDLFLLFIFTDHFY